MKTLVMEKIFQSISNVGHVGKSLTVLEICKNILWQNTCKKAIYH